MTGLSICDTIWMSSRALSPTVTDTVMSPRLPVPVPSYVPGFIPAALFFAEPPCPSELQPDSVADAATLPAATRPATPKLPLTNPLRDKHPM